MIEKPNIIIINPDEMRASALGHLGNKAAHTPNIDKLIDEGVSFSHAFCQNPVCVPSRCSFMTGLYPHTTGHRTMAYLLHPGEENLFSDMKKAGYHTISSTRGDLMAGQYPSYHRSCVDEYIKIKTHGKKITPIKGDRGKPDSDTFFSFDNGVLQTKSPCYNNDDFTVDGVIRSIKKRPKNKPFFLFAGLFFPHPPYEIEKKYYDMINKKLLSKRIRNIRPEDKKPLMEQELEKELRVASWSEERIDEIQVIYLAMCAKIDNQAGRIISALKEEGIYDNTAIIFMSDHGDYAGDYGIVEKAQNVFPDCLTNVPLVIKPPKNRAVNPGIRDQLVELTDLCATCWDLAGYKVSRDQFGKTLMPLVAEKTEKGRDYVFSEGGRLPGESQCTEFYKNKFNKYSLYAPRKLIQVAENGAHGKAVMIRDNHFKYVMRLFEKDEFYDLKKGESFNLIDDPTYQEQISKLKTQLTRWYILTSDVVPQKLDERNTGEGILNMLKANGLTPFKASLLRIEAVLTHKSLITVVKKHAASLFKF